MSAAGIDLDRHAQPGEAKMARALVRTALAKGYAVSVNDGEETTVTRSTDRDAILAALASTDADCLTIHRADFNNASGHHVAGSLYLVWGNEPDGSELIADHTDNPAMQWLYDTATALADQL